MKKFLISLALFASPLLAVAGPDIGITVNIGEPNYYGPLQQLGNWQPQVLFAEPIIIQRVPNMVNQPLYLRVPPGHYKKWNKYCGRYNACDRRVYFVKEDWYNKSYAPQYYRDNPGRGHGRGNAGDDGRGKGHGNGNGYGNDEGYSNWNGNGHGHGHGKGR